MASLKPCNHMIQITSQVKWHLYAESSLTVKSARKQPKEK